MFCCNVCSAILSAVCTFIWGSVANNHYKIRKKYNYPSWHINGYCALAVFFAAATIFYIWQIFTM